MTTLRYCVYRMKDKNGDSCGPRLPLAQSLSEHSKWSIDEAFDTEEEERLRVVWSRPSPSVAVHPGPGLFHDYSALFSAKNRAELPRDGLQLELSLRRLLRIYLAIFVYLLRVNGSSIKPLSQGRAPNFGMFTALYCLSSGSAYTEVSGSMRDRIAP